MIFCYLRLKSKAGAAARIPLWIALRLLVHNCLMRILLIAAALLIAASASAEMYKYTDRSGAVTLTDSIEKVPPEYRKSARPLKKEEYQTDGYTPPVTPNGMVKGSSEWEKVPPVTTATRKAADVVRRFMSSLQGPRMLVAIALVITVIVPVLATLLIRKHSIRFTVIAVLLVTAYVALASVYLSERMDQGGKIFDSLDKTLQIIEKKNAVTNGVIKEQP